MIALGIGAQAPVKGKLELSEETKTVLRHDGRFHDLDRRARRLFGRRSCGTSASRTSASSAARPRSAATTPISTIQLPPLDKIRTAGITLRREVSPTYAQDIKHYLTFHRDLVKDLAGRFDVVLMAQGEVEEKKIVLGTPEQKEEAFAALQANKTGSTIGISTRRWRSSTASGCSIPTSSPITRTWCSRRISCSAIACTAT